MAPVCDNFKDAGIHQCLHNSGLVWCSMRARLRFDLEMLIKLAQEVVNGTGRIRSLVDVHACE